MSGCTDNGGFTRKYSKYLEGLQKLTPASRAITVTRKEENEAQFKKDIFHVTQNVSVSTIVSSIFFIMKAKYSHNPRR
jgi:hypothetical protein